MPFDQALREADHEAQLKWLHGWWHRIDGWISENQPRNAEVPGLVLRSEDDTAEAVEELPDPDGRLHMPDKSAPRSRCEPQNGPEVTRDAAPLTARAVLCRAG